MKKVFYSIAVLSCLYSCQEKALKNSLILNDTTSLALGESKINYDKRIVLSFDSVVYDNRCPLNVQCTIEGFATLKFKFEASSKLTSFYLKTLPQDSVNKKTIKNYNIELVGLTNFPVITNASKKYYAKVIVKEIK